MSQQLTTANKILVAAAHLDQEKGQFTAEDLIVRAWNDYPESFGLSGYNERYPDSNRVLAKLMGSVGLCNRGWLEQVSTKTYKMTASGRKYAHALETLGPEGAAEAKGGKPAAAAPKPKAAPAPAGSSPAAPSAKHKGDLDAVRARLMARDRPTVVSAKPPAKAAHSVAVVTSPARGAAPAPRAAAPEVEGRFDAAALQRLVTSVANQKWARGGMVTFQDACAFWGISPSVHASQLGPRLADVDAVLQGASERIQETQASVRVNDRLEVTFTSVIGLQGLHRTMLQKYRRELETIQKRSEDKQ